MTPYLIIYYADDTYNYSVVKANSDREVKVKVELALTELSKWFLKKQAQKETR